MRGSGGNVSSSRSGRTSHRRARGQGLVEFALVAPLLIGLAFGIFDFGRGMSANITVTNSSREGARYLATQASTLSSPYGTTCPTGTTAPTGTSAQSKAWNQMLGASLDMTRVTLLTVYFYKSSNDPSADTARTAYDKTVSCNLSGGAFTGSSTVTAGSNTGDSSYVPQTGDWVQFRVQYQYTTATPIIHQLVATVTVDQTTTMVLE
ncbi:MAG TPA: TadE family protein [Candidatus Dormibacteraeota bacterium]